MAEIPAHLLDRTKARKAALGMGGGDGPAAESGEGGGVATSVVTAPAGNSPVAAPPIGTAKSLPPAITGPKQLPPLKNHLPWYVLPVLMALPIWAVFYYGSLRTDSAKKETALVDVPGALIITSQNFSFAPPTADATVGQTIEYKNLDNTAHTLTFDDLSKDTGNVTGPAIKTFIVDKAGTYGYKCTIHPSMTGTIVVK